MNHKPLQILQIDFYRLIVINEMCFGPEDDFKEPQCLQLGVSYFNSHQGAAW